MRFVCERCHTRYSIADEKVRQKILRIRCKKCGEVIEIHNGSSASSGVVDFPHAPVPPPPPPPPRGAVVPPPLPPPAITEWYVACNGTSHGPFTCIDASRRILAIKETDEVYVWKDGMVGWKPARDVPAIAHELAELSRVVVPLEKAPSLPPPPPSIKKGAASKAPTPSPKVAPTPSPKVAPTSSPKVAPTPSPKVAPTPSPKVAPTPSPRVAPTPSPRVAPTPSPRVAATELPKLRASAISLPSNHSTSGAESSSPDSQNQSPGTTPNEDGIELSFFDTFPTEAKPLVPDEPLPLIKDIASLPSAMSIATTAEPGKATSPVPIFLPSPTHLFPTTSMASAVVHGAEAGLSRLTGFAALAHRHQGLKYLIAASSIVILVILLVILSLRGNGGKQSDPALSKVPGNAIGSLKSDREIALAIEGAVDTKSDPNETVVRVQPRKSPARSTTVASAPVPASSPAPAPVQARARVNAEQVAAQQRMARPSKNMGPGKTNPFASSGQTVTQEQITAVVKNKNNQVALKLCYDRALKLDDRLTNGRIDVTVSVGISGRVQNVILSSPSRFYVIGECIKSVVRRWVFPASSEEYATSFPLILQGGM